MGSIWYVQPAAAMRTDRSFTVHLTLGSKLVPSPGAVSAINRYVTLALNDADRSSFGR